MAEKLKPVRVVVDSIDGDIDTGSVFLADEAPCEEITFGWLTRAGVDPSVILSLQPGDELVITIEVQRRQDG